MSYIAANNCPVLDAFISLPRSGAWYADLHVDTQDAGEVTGPVFLAVGDAMSFQGTSVRPPSVFADSVRVRIVGGMGTLGRSIAKPKSYQGVPWKLPFQDIVRDAGEALSPRSDAGLLATRLTAWATLQQPAGEALAKLMQAAEGACWRILPDGNVWAGYETWPAADGQLEYVLAREDTAVAALQIFSEAPALSPGYTLLGRRIGRVTHQWHADKMVSTAHWETEVANA
jgi:hypothetical protein